MKIKVSLILALTVLFHFAAFCMEEKNMLKSSYADLAKGDYISNVNNILSELNQKDVSQAVRSRQLLRLFTALNKIDPDYSCRILEEQASLFDRDTTAALLGTVAISYINVDRQKFQTVFEKLLKLPSCRARNAAACKVFTAFTGNPSMKPAKKNLANYQKAKEMFLEYLQTQKSEPQELVFLYENFLPVYFACDYTDAKKMLSDYEKVLESNSLKDVNHSLYSKVFDFALWFNDLPLAKHAQALSSGLHRIQIALWERNQEECIRELDLLMTQKKKSEQQMKLALLKAVVQDESVRNNPSIFFDKNPAENEVKLKITRQVTSILYLAKREDLVRPVMQWIDRTLLQTKYEHFYDVQFTEHAPDTASVWVQTKYYNDWENMETRFYPYGSVSNHSHKKDVEFHLKGAETKKLDDTYRAGVHFLADKRGLHIYVRLNTPETEQIRAGLAKGGTLECLFKPGYDEAYHQWFFQNLPGTGEPTEPIWDCPNGKYQLTTDVMQKDACITDEACTAHTFIPWEYFCSSLPLNGNMWYYGLQIWDKDSKTLSGSVHEQERMIRLRFHFTKEQELAVKRFCAIRAYSKYKAVRQDKNGFIEAWKTDLLGDPEFYSECLEQYLRELDEAGETLLKTDSDAQTDSIFNQYASDWMNIRWKIDSMRTKYLKKKFSAL